MSAVSGVRLLGTGSALPSRVLRNADLCTSLDTTEEWIFTRTGIRERRICGPNETTASLGLAAARAALESAGLQASALDLLICATVTPDTLSPATACHIQGGLDCGPIPAFDLNAACSGFLYALAVGAQFLRTGTYHRILVVGSDTLSKVVDYTDRATCILFGDGAGAVVLGAADEVDGPQVFRLHAAGTRKELIRLNGVATRPPAMSPVVLPFAEHQSYVSMNGREVFKFAVQTICKSIKETLEASRLTSADVDLIVPHQVNQRILDAAFPQLGIPAEKIMVNLERYGNTAAASIPIALDEAVRSGRARPGDTVLMIAFGAGLTWASAIMTVPLLKQTRSLAA